MLTPQVLAATELCLSPLMEICITGDAFERRFTKGFIFSSTNGVAAASVLTADRDVPCYCVGPATTRAATEAGWPAEQRGEDAESLISSLLQRRPPAPLLHLRGANARGAIAQRLSDNGLRTREKVIYDQRRRPLTTQAEAALNGTRPVIAPLFSPRTAQLLVEAGPGQAPLHVVAMSRAVAEVVERLSPRTLTVSGQPNAQAMAEAIENVAAQVCRLERGEGGG